MKALMKWESGAGHVALRETERPVPGPDEVLIRVAAAGICGTDIHVFNGHHPTAVFPLVPGHEFVGELVQISGEGAEGFELGDTVVAQELLTCGRCDACAKGEDNVCEHLKIIGVHADGGFAEYVRVKTRKMYRVPKSVDLRRAALIEPLAVAVHDVRMSGLKIGESALIVGGGPIGQRCAQLAAKFGAAELTLSEPVESRCELAKKIGVEHIINPITEDVYERAMEITNGLGYDVIIECSAVPSAAETVLKCTSKYANLLYVAQFPTDYELPLNLFEYSYMRQVNVTGMYCAHFNFERTAEYLKYVDLSAFTSDEQVYDIDDVEAAFAMHLTSKYPKILIRCNKFEGE